MISGVTVKLMPPIECRLIAMCCSTFFEPICFHELKQLEVATEAENDAPIDENLGWIFTSVRLFQFSVPFDFVAA